MREAVALACLAVAMVAAAEARPVKPPKSSRQAPPAFEPYDPDRQRAGRRPGFIDLGGGTEVRISGRVRLDHDRRH